MVRQRVLLQPKRLGDLGRPHAVRGKAHQQPKDGQAAGMAKRGEGVGGAIFSIFPEYRNMVTKSSEGFVTGRILPS